MRIRIHPTLYAYLMMMVLLASWETCVGAIVALFVHELGHCLTSILMKERFERLELTPFGGVMIYKRGTCPYKGIRGVLVHAAGPIGNYLLLLCISLPRVQRFANPQILRFLITSNASMFLLNLLPALPLDGGHIVLCLGYYFFPIVRLIRFLSGMGKIMGIAGITLAVYGLFFRKILNCSLLIVSIYMIFSAAQSQKTLLAENIYIVIHERLSDLPRVQRIEHYRVTSNASLYELIPYLKEGVSVSFRFLENDQDLELTEHAFCHALCVSTSLSVKEAYHLFALHCEKTSKNHENTSIPS